MGKVWDNIKRHRVTFMMGVIPLCLALATYLYLDFSKSVDSTLSGSLAMPLIYVIGFLAVIGVIGVLMGPKVDAERNSKSD